MPTHRNRPTHYNPRAPQPPSPPLGIRWWRGRNYALTPDGRHIICQGPFRQKELSPRDIDWDTVLGWSRHTSLRPGWTDAPPTFVVPDEETRESMLRWCAFHGCPGTLLFQAHTLGGRLGIEVDYDDDPGNGRDVFLRYRRMGPRWVVESTYCERYDPDHESDSDPEALAGAELDEHWQDVTMTDDRQLGHVTTLDATGVAQFLTCPVSECPPPQTPQFWAVYREPILELLRASWRLRQWVSQIVATDGRAQRAAASMEPHTGFVLNDDGVPELRVASLFHAFALRNRSDLRACPCCLTGFYPRSPRQIYCTTTCQRRCGKRRERAQKA